RREPRAAPRSAGDSNEQKDSGDADAVEECRVDVVRPRLRHRIIFGERGCPVSQRWRVDVIETRASIPERLPWRVRPMFLEKTRLGDECALDGRPLVHVLGLE